jgi:hypothetical protein
MSGTSLRQLEHEVEAARAKLASDLSTLRSPAAYSEFTEDLKNEALEVKDTLIQKAKSTVQSAVEGIVEDFKARAASNPAAALAIGAGIAWRLIKRPPIATALIGVGLFSLWRTTPIPANGRDNIDYLSQAKERLKEQASNLAGDVKEQAMEVAGAVKEQATELTGTAKETVQHWGAETRAAGQQAASDFKVRTAAVAHQASGAFDALSDQRVRDNLLLGAAGVAVATALGIAYQRRFNAGA